jgi:excisionase family DNA binding protein
MCAELQEPSIALDDLVRSPDRATSLSNEDLWRLIIRCGAIQSLLFARLLLARDPSAAGPPSNEEELLTVPDVARLVGVRVAYIYELVRRGELPAVKLGKYIRLSRRSVARWMERNLVGSPSIAPRRR